MINKIIDASLDNRFVVLLLVVLLIAVGVWSMTKLPVDAVPDLTNVQVQVLTTSPSLGPDGTPLIIASSARKKIKVSGVLSILIQRPEDEPLDRQ